MVVISVHQVQEFFLNVSITILIYSKAMYTSGSLNLYHVNWTYDSQGYGAIPDQNCAGAGWDQTPVTSDGIFHWATNRNANAGIHYHNGSLI